MTIEQLDSFLRSPMPQERGKPGTDPAVTAANQNSRAEKMTCARYPRFAEITSRQRDWLEILYVYDGSCTVELGGTVYTLEKGQCVLLDRQAVFRLLPLGAEDILLSITFPGSYLKEHFLRGLTRQSRHSQYLLNSLEGGGRHDGFFVFRSQGNHRVAFAITEWVCEILEPSADSEDMIRCLFALAQCELDRCIRQDADRGDVSEKACDTSVLPMLNYITENYQTVTLREMAKHFHLNPNYLSSVLKEKTGLTFQNLLIRQRIQAAQQLLTNSSLPVTEIARQVGYDNTSFFYKKFREITGKSPADLRKG